MAPADTSSIMGSKRWGQEVAIFRQTAVNFRQRIFVGAEKCQILLLNSPKIGNFQVHIRYFLIKISDNKTILRVGATVPCPYSPTPAMTSLAVSVLIHSLIHLFTHYRRVI